MIKMCDLPRYADADMEEIKKMKEAHTVLNQVTYEPKPLYHGYTDKRLRINVTDNTIDMIDIPQEVKENLPAAKVIACVICGMQRSRIQSGTLRKMPLPCRQDRLPELRSTAVPENAWYAAFHR